MRLLASHLRRAGACSIDAFKRIFPDGAPLTKKSLRLARAANLDLGWLKGALVAVCRPNNQCRICAKRAKIFPDQAALRKLLRGVRI